MLCSQKRAKDKNKESKKDKLEEELDLKKESSGSRALKRLYKRMKRLGAGDDKPSPELKRLKKLLEKY